MGASCSGFAFADSLAIKCVVLLGIPDIIAREGPHATVSLHEIAARLPTDSPHASACSESCVSSLLRASSVPLLSKKAQRTVPARPDTAWLPRPNGSWNYIPLPSLYQVQKIKVSCEKQRDKFSGKFSLSKGFFKSNAMQFEFFGRLGQGSSLGDTILQQW